jgi:hypothetical protein
MPGKINAKSENEKYFKWWLDELFEAGIIKGYEIQPDSFLLSHPAKYNYEKQIKTKVNMLKGHLFSKHIYTPDFKIIWVEHNNAFCNQLFSGCNYKKLDRHIINQSGVSYIEIKPEFDQNNMTREFRINQKWLYDKHNIYINLIYPTAKKKKCLFSETFTPKKYFYTPSGRKRKVWHWEPRSLEQFLEIRKGE